MVRIASHYKLIVMNNSLSSREEKSRLKVNKFTLESILDMYNAGYSLRRKYAHCL